MDCKDRKKTALCIIHRVIWATKSRRAADGPWERGVNCPASRKTGTNLYVPQQVGNMTTVSFTIKAHGVRTSVIGPHVHVPQALSANQEHSAHETSSLIRQTIQVFHERTHTILPGIYLNLRHRPMFCDVSYHD